MNHESVKKLMKDPNNLKDLMNPTPEIIFEKGRNLPEFVDIINLILNVPKDQIERDIEHYFLLKVGSSTSEPKSENKPQPQSNTTPKTSKQTKGEEAFHLANDHFVFEQYEEALAQYDLAIAAEHSNLHYLLNRAACYLKLGDDVLALEDCNYAIKKGLKSPRVYYLKALAYKSINKPDQAKEANAEGLKLYPTDESLIKQSKQL